MIDTVALLLADRSPALRRRALVEVDGTPPDDPEVAALAAAIPDSPEVRSVADDRRSEPWYRLCRLAYLGLGRGHPGVDRLAEDLFAEQLKDGSWAPRADWGSTVYQWRPLQTALPLRGLASAGYATDPRAERAYEWLLDRRLDDGSWPYGLVEGRTITSGTVGYRRLPASDGCRATTTAALACLAQHPDRARSEATQRSADLLLRRETREEWTLGFEVARLLGVEEPRGFATFYARFDLAFLLGLVAGTGVSAEDERVADLVTFLLAKRGPYGLWEHPTHPQLSRWLTLDLMASLKRVAAEGWTGSDHRMNFQPYPKRRTRH